MLESRLYTQPYISRFTLNQIVDYGEYQRNTDKTRGSNKRIIDALKTLQEEKYLVECIPTRNTRLNDLCDTKINTNLFEPKTEYGKLYLTEIEIIRQSYITGKISASDNDIFNRLLHTYAFFKAYRRTRNNSIQRPEELPEIYFDTYGAMAQKVGFSRDTLSNYIHMFEDMKLMYTDQVKEKNKNGDYFNTVTIFANSEKEVEYGKQYLHNPKRFDFNNK